MQLATTLMGVTTALVIVDTQAMGFLAQVRSFIMFVFNAPLRNISFTNLFFMNKTISKQN